MTRVRTRFSAFIGGRNLGDRQALAAATNPMCTAIDVRPPRYVTSPIAQIPGTVVAQVSSTTTWPAGVLATPLASRARCVGILSGEETARLVDDRHFTAETTERLGQLPPPSTTSRAGSRSILNTESLVSAPIRFGSALLDGRVVASVASSAADRNTPTAHNCAQRAETPVFPSLCAQSAASDGCVTRDGTKPSIHDANTPNGEKTTRPSAPDHAHARTTERLLIFGRRNTGHRGTNPFDRFGERLSLRRRCDQRLRGDAAGVRALAVEGTLADQHHAGTAPGGLSGRFDWPAGF